MPLFMDVHTLGDSVAAADVAETVSRVHRKAHGLVAGEIHEVGEYP